MGGKRSRKPPFMDISRQLRKAKCGCGESRERKRKEDRERKKENNKIYRK